MFTLFIVSFYGIELFKKHFGFILRYNMLTLKKYVTSK